MTTATTFTDWMRTEAHRLMEGTAPTIAARLLDRLPWLPTRAFGVEVEVDYSQRELDAELSYGRD